MQAGPSKPAEQFLQAVSGKRQSNRQPQKKKTDVHLHSIPFNGFTPTSRRICRMCYWRFVSPSRAVICVEALFKTIDRWNRIGEAI